VAPPSGRGGISRQISGNILDPIGRRRERRRDGRLRDLRALRGDNTRLLGGRDLLFQATDLAGRLGEFVGRISPTSPNCARSASMRSLKPRTSPSR
jgi:hypothetical protein